MVLNLYYFFHKWLETEFENDLLFEYRLLGLLIIIQI